jgi:polysaccharide deacetylase family protein (PEP-CTERM system associated)
MGADRLLNSFTVDVEDWFHILDSNAVPSIEHWSGLETRVDQNMERILDLLATYGVKATLFWLGWVASRHRGLLRRCLSEGHEIASHGYAHLLPYRVGERLFRNDISRAKSVLEDITGKEVAGFRAPGFGILDTTPWAFDIIRETGYLYDASVFPAHRGHGGQAHATLLPHIILTKNGELCEIPTSVVRVLGRRLSLFGGGYLRLASKRMIKWGIDRLETAGQPLVVYIHPREIDPDQPRLSLPLSRRFKCYVGLKSTLPKLKWLFQNYSFSTMLGMIEDYKILLLPKKTGLPY